VFTKLIRSETADGRGLSKDIVMPPFFHHGLFTTLRGSVLAHSGEALESRRAFQAASEYDQDSLVEFLKSLQVLPLGTKDLIVDENYRKKKWPLGPLGASFGSGVSWRTDR
jgi:hypothetical protein